MNDTHKYNELLRILDAIVEDLKRMLAIPVIPKAMGNCGAPIATYCFTCMDFLGALIQVSDESLPAYRHIKDFVDVTFSDAAKEELGGEGAHNLAQLHYGFTRTFMPLDRRPRVSIGRQHGDLFYCWHEGEISLDADKLAVILIDAVKAFDEMLRNDAAVLVRVWDNLERMMRPL